MASAFEKFKNRQSYSSMIAQKMNSSNQNRKDERFWELTRDPETGKGEAVIRFLPPKSTDSEAMPYVKFYSHFFKGDDGKWVVTDACPRSFGNPCPICERNMKLYNSGNIERYRRSKPKTNYLFNILVVNDPAAPENNGKVFLFKTGQTIFTMITEAMQSEYDEPAMPFEVEDGNCFIYRSRKDPARGGLISYDKSKFDNHLSPIAEDEDELRRIFDSMYDLEAVVNELGAKTDVNLLEQKCKSAFIENDPGANSFDPVMAQSNTAKSAVEEMDNLPWDEEPVKEEKPQKTKEQKPIPTAEPMPSEDEEDDDLDFFRKLAN